MKRTAGYSIVELLVTLVVLGIVVSITIPGFSRWLPDYQLKTAATELYSNLQLAKMYAVRDNTKWSIIFLASCYGFKKEDVLQTEPPFALVWLSEYKGGVGYGAGDATESIPPSGSAPTDFITFPGDEIVFSPRGMADSQGYVYLQNDKNTTYAVGALTTGLILMRKWTGAAWE
jgi:prepilin-type N-terminal cleavage/methylation domain-containing protein